MTGVSTADSLARSISDRLATISTANGYFTEIGTRVYRGKMKLSPEELPCVVIVEGDDEVADTRPGEAQIMQPYIIEGHDACDPDHPNDKAHAIIADIKRCLFIGDTTFAGLVRKGKLTYAGRRIGVREDGASIIAASISIKCEIHEDLKNP